jgi:hypothetical protein
VCLCTGGDAGAGDRQGRSDSMWSRRWSTRQKVALGLATGAAAATGAYYLGSWVWEAIDTSRREAEAFINRRRAYDREHNATRCAAPVPPHCRSRPRPQFASSPPGRTLFTWDTARTRPPVSARDTDCTPPPPRDPTPFLSSCSTSSHFRNVQSICDATTLPSLLPHLEAKLSQAVAVTVIMDRLEECKTAVTPLPAAEKYALWEELKLRSKTPRNPACRCPRGKPSLTEGSRGDRGSGLRCTTVVVLRSVHSTRSGLPNTATPCPATAPDTTHYVAPTQGSSCEVARVINRVTEAGRLVPGRGGATAFVAAAGAAVAASVLAVFLRVQLNLVGRYLYLDLAFETAQVRCWNPTQWLAALPTSALRRFEGARHT